MTLYRSIFVVGISTLRVGAGIGTTGFGCSCGRMVPSGIGGIEDRLYPWRLRMLRFRPTTVGFGRSGVLCIAWLVCKELDAESERSRVRSPISVSALVVVACGDSLEFESVEFFL